MRIASITWGLTLVCIGTILLLDNFGVINFHWTVIWKAWPILFILLGVRIIADRLSPQMGNILVILTTIIALAFIVYRGTHYSRQSYQTQHPDEMVFL